MQIKDMITGRRHMDAPEAKLREVARLLVGHDFGAIPVVGKDANVVVSDLVARFVARIIDLQDLSSEGAMTGDPMTVSRTGRPRSSIDRMQPWSTYKSKDATSPASAWARSS